MRNGDVDMQDREVEQLGREDRAAVRHRLRELIEKAEDAKNIVDTLNRANDLFRNVRNAEDATLDSKTLRIAASLNLQNARDLKLSSSFFHFSEYTASLLAILSVNGEMDWAQLEGNVSRTSKRPPTMDLLLGPLSRTPKEKIRRQATRIVRDENALVKPTQVNSLFYCLTGQLQDNDIASQENETNENVKKIYIVLTKNSPIQFFRFIINPHSFAQTVENLFYLSFLIREDKASITIIKGEPVLAAIAMDEDEDDKHEKVSKQLVLSMDMQLWEVMTISLKLTGRVR